MRNRHNKGFAPWQQGFSLVELMVAMTIALILLLGLTVMFSNASSNFRELSNTSRQLENGRYALQVLRDDLRHAGFYDYYLPNLTPSALLDPCAITVATLRDTVGRLHIQGYNDTRADMPAATCLPNRVADTDVLTLVRAGTEVVGTSDDTTALVPGTIYLQTVRDTLVIDDGANDSAFNLLLEGPGSLPANIRRMVVHTYYIRSCNVCAPASDNIPTLVRQEFGGATVALAEGIEQMFLRYGLDMTNDGNPDVYLTADDGALNPAAAEWANVVTVELNLLARNPQESLGYTDTRDYILGGPDGITLTPGGPFKRQVFTAVARLENISQRRERQ